LNTSSNLARFPQALAVLAAGNGTFVTAKTGSRTKSAHIAKSQYSLPFVRQLEMATARPQVGFARQPAIPCPSFATFGLGNLLAMTNALQDLDALQLLHQPDHPRLHHRWAAHSRSSMEPIDTLTGYRLRIGIALTALLLTMVLLFSTLLRISERTQSTAEFSWMRRAMYDLDVVRSSMSCFMKRNGTPPTQFEDLIHLGCLTATTTFEASRNAVYEMPLVADNHWDRKDQLLLRRATGTMLDPNSIVAVALPDERFWKTCLVLRQDGIIESVTNAAYNENPDAFRKRLGGSNLWPVAP
jgi:hypothetical protein